ncbi:hypothetical protein C8Q76DRAFT_801030 [Earliella scabrosa]|nr:hypothetical protein C8Q76DRAFT_801030 [Earliella scabrosa]
MPHVYEALHVIVVKDQDLYVRDDEGLKAIELLLSPSLQSTTGATQKRHRKTLNLVFATSTCATSPLCSTTAEAIDMSHWMGRTALELIGQGALEHSFDSFFEESNDEYTEATLRDRARAHAKKVAIESGDEGGCALDLVASGARYASECAQEDHDDDIPHGELSQDAVCQHSCFTRP